jgi:tetratricopeptide (TPR) repeat protein
MKRGFLMVTVWLAVGAALWCGCASSSRAGKAAGKAAPPRPPHADSLATLSNEQLEERVKAFAHFAAGISSDLNEDPDAALDHYYQSASADPEHETLAVDLARRFLARKEPEKAIDILKKATASREASGRLFALLGLSYAEAGQMEEALQANRDAIGRSPELLNGYRNLIALYLDSRRYAEALKVMDEAAGQSSEDPAFWVDLAELYASYSRLRREESEAVKAKTIAALDRAAALKPQNLLLIQKLADGYKLMDELPKAEPFYLELIDRFPALPGTREKLADIYLRLDQKDKAAEQFEAISKDNPGNPQPYYVLGILALQEKRLSDAADYFKRALTVKPEFEPTYYELANMKIALNKADEALEVLAKARARFRPNFALEYYTARAHARDKKYAEALKHFTDAEVIGKANEPDRLNHVFYFEYGAALERHGDYAEAEKYFRKCLELSPNFSEALNYLGYMWAERGENLEEARKLISKAVELEPDNAAYLDSMAWVLFKLKQPREALRWIEKALEHIEEPDPTLYDHLGDIQAELGQREKAHEAWRKSVQLEPSDQVKSKLQSAPVGAAPK